MTLLITGFGPFDGGSNASEALVRALASDPNRLAQWSGEWVHTLVLPVDTQTAPDLLIRAIEAYYPDRILLMGQAAGRNRICLERVAHNRRSFNVPDISGAMIADAPVIHGGAASYASTWPDLPGLAADLNGRLIPTAVSEDCGTHLCNQVLYTALHFAWQSDREHATMFVHLPLLPEQVIANEPAALRHRRCAFMPLDMTLGAVEAILRHSRTRPDPA